ncbi:MAG: hypothetical protein ABFS32_14875 [Bacteroidota bacterium]
MKKQISLLAIITILAFPVLAQVPAAFNYQAVVRNNSGEVVSNQNVSFRISILQDSETGTIVYSEAHNVTTNDFGLANLKIGEGTVIDGVFSPGGWGVANHFIKIELDPAGGSSYVHTGTSQLLAVPYAFHAGTVENDQVDDADADPSNEIQTLSVSGNDLSISDGNNVTLPGSLWMQNGDEIYYDNNVGIGTTNPAFELDIVDASTAAYARIQSIANNAALVIERAPSGDMASTIYKTGGANSFYTGLLSSNSYKISTTNPVLNGLEVEFDGDVNLSDNLDVNGTTKLGPSGMVFSEIREFTGTTGTGHSNEVSYPSGYTYTNTRVLSLEVNYANAMWCSMGQYVGTAVAGYNVSCTLRFTGIMIYYPDDATMHNKPFRMVLMKFE